MKKPIEKQKKKETRILLFFNKKDGLKDLSGFEIFTNLGKLYSFYDKDKLGVSRYTLDRVNLYEGYTNDICYIQKIEVSA